MRKFLLLVICLGVFSSVNAELRLPKALADNMVLQQSDNVNLWGWADANANVEITTSWSDNPTNTKADAQGKWLVTIATPKASFDKQTLIFKSKKQILELKNILIGEVWVCSGQSNMHMRMSGNAGQPIKDALEDIMTSAKYKDRVRLLGVQPKGSSEPLDDLIGGTWTCPNPTTTYDYSATAYYFAQYLSDILDVPVGLISNSWGGSIIEAWIDTATAATIEGLDTEKLDKVRKLEQMKSHLIFNAMVLPLVNYTAKGFLWFQGESNRKTPELYGREFKAMVALWRGLWKNDKMPFYYAQIAPFDYGDKNGIDAPLFVEQQLKSLKEVPYSEIVATSDLGIENCVHPPYKKKVGFRFANLALRKTYNVGSKLLPITGPKVTKVVVEDAKIVVSFDVKKGLFANYGDPKGFYLSGNDKVFHLATAKILYNPTRVEVTCDKVPNPVAVRYGFKNFSDANLFDVYGLPAFPFRTDGWDDVK